MAFNVHTIKGSAANLGAVHVVEICQQIESSAGTRRAGSVERLLAELERETPLAQAALTRLAEPPRTQARFARDDVQRAVAGTPDRRDDRRHGLPLTR